MFPDPNSDTLVAARAWFQSHASPGTTVVSVVRADNSTTRTWITTYLTDGEFPSPHRNNFIEAKKLFQKSYLPDGIVKVVSITEREDGSSLWSVQSSKRTTSCWKTTIKTVVFSRSKVDDVECTPVLKVKIQRKDTILFVEPQNVLDTDLPKRLFLKQDVTRRYTGRRSLNRRLFGAIKDRLINNEDANKIKHHVTSLLRPKPGVVQFVKPQADQEAVNEESNESVVVEETCTSPSTPAPRTYAAVAYDYSKVNKMYRMSRLQDPRIFALVRRYISSCLGFQGYGKIPVMRPDCTPIELANAVSTAGLPLDESLRELYLEYCSSRGICEDAECELRNFAIAERQRLKRHS